MPYNVPLHKEQEYCLGVGMSIYFKILSNPKPGVGDESSEQFLMFHIYCKNTQYNYASDGISICQYLEQFSGYNYLQYTFFP